MYVNGPRVQHHCNSQVSCLTLPFPLFFGNIVSLPLPCDSKATYEHSMRTPMPQDCNTTATHMSRLPGWICFCLHCAGRRLEMSNPGLPLLAETPIMTPKGATLSLPFLHCMLLFCFWHSLCGKVQAHCRAESSIGTVCVAEGCVLCRNMTRPAVIKHSGMIIDPIKCNKSAASAAKQTKSKDRKLKVSVSAGIPRPSRR